MSKISFGTDGWRAIIAGDFTFDNVNLVAKAIGIHIKSTYKNKPVLVGYDTRFLAREFAMEVSNVMNDMGLNTLVSSKPVPTPVIAFAAKNLNSAGAIMITASHNPPEYCGIKYIPDYAGPATSDITDEIVSNINLLQDGSIEFKQATQRGSLEYIHPKEKYFEFLTTILDVEKFKNLELKVAYDSLYGTGQNYLSVFLPQISKCKVRSLHNHRDVLFGGGMPDPVEGYLTELKEFVIENKYNVGLSNDGDADRAGIIDENGEFYAPNRIIPLLLRHLVKNRNFKGAVVRTLATTHLLDKLAKLYNLELIETPVGFKYIGEEMRARDVIIGGEESGGLSILGHIPEKDGILANLLILEMLAYEKKPLSQIWKDLIAEVGCKPYGKRLDLHLTPENKKFVMAKFKDETPSEVNGLKVTGIKTIDGVKLYFEDSNSWLLVRPSGTEPIIRVYLETDSQEKLDSLEIDIKSIIFSLHEEEDEEELAEII